MAKWVEIRKGADFQEIGVRFGITPFTARLIRNKDIVGEEQIEQYLHGDCRDLHPATLMKGVTEAVALLREKIEKKHPSGSLEIMISTGYVLLIYF